MEQQFIDTELVAIETLASLLLFGHAGKKPGGQK